MPWFKKSQPNHTLNDFIRSHFKNQTLKDRTAKACKDNTNYVLRLKNIMVNNRNNLRLLTQIAGHMQYLKSQGVDLQEAAKETIETIYY